MAEGVKDASLWRWLRPHAPTLALGLFFVLAVVAVDVALPKLFGDYLIDGVLLARDGHPLLGKIAAGGIGIVLLRGVFTYGMVYLTSYVGQQVVYELRSKMYRHLLDMPLGEHARTNSGHLVARMTSDVGVIQSAVTAGVTDLVQHTVTLVAIVAMLFVVNWRLALISAVIFPVAGFAIDGYGKRVRRFTSRLQERIAALTATLQESLEGIRIVKAFRMEKERRGRFEEDNRQSFGASMKSVQAMATVTPVVELIVASGMMVVIWYGGRAVLSGEMSPGGLLSFLVYLGMATRPLGYITKSLNIVQQAASASERVAEVLRRPVESEDAGERLRPRGIEGFVEFEGVSFAYQAGRPVLKEISLSVRPGESVALVGPSGAGKSTLVNLIPGFYTPTAGRVLIDGRDIRRLDLGFLRRYIGLVPQETLLFGMTIAENIAAGREWITREMVVEAAKAANAHDFITSLPDGYDTVVGERGADLSGGERQRIAIARAIAGDPRILILDEATSALDAESEALVRDALARVQEGRTTFIIAHRLSTVRGASKIAVLDEGRLVEVGTHEELIKAGRVYPRLYRTQFGGGVEAPEGGYGLPEPAEA